VRRPILVLGLLAGCGFDAAHDGTAYRCEASGRCPEGMVCVDGACRVPCGQHWIDNGTFEDDSSAWGSSTASLQLADDGHGGERSLQVCATQGDGENYYAHSASIQVTAADVGVELRFEAWVRAVGAPEQRCQAGLKESDADSTELQRLSSEVVLDDTWQRLVTRMIPTAEGNSAVGFATVIAASAGDCFQLDDVCVAPTTTAAAR
jgi:hypothetical protein